MNRISIGSLKEHLDEIVTIQGWLQILRDQKKMQFLILRDRTGLVQVANYRPENPDLGDLISSLSTESAGERLPHGLALPGPAPEAESAGIPR